MRNLYAGQEATEPDMEQRTGSKLGKEYVNIVYCHPAYSTSIQSASGETLGWMKFNLESTGFKIAGRNINNLSYADDTTLRAESKEELKSLVMKVKEESEKALLKYSIHKLRSWHPIPSLHGK